MKAPQWERLSREVVFEGRVVDVFRDTVRIERDGEEREAVYDLVHHPGAVAIVAVFDDGTVALVDQFRYAVGASIREIPAGTLEEGESFESCAERELAEEIGCRAERWTALATVFTTPGFSDEKMRIFLAEELSEAAGERDQDEHLEVVRVPLRVAVDQARRGEIEDAKTVAGLALAWARLQER